MRVHTLPLILCLSVPLGCGGGHDPRDGADPQAPYVICDGSDDVRLAMVAFSGDEIESTDKYSKPYGDRFTYVNGKCEYLAGESRMGQIVQGTLTQAQAVQLSDRLELTTLDWAPQDDCFQSHAGSLQIETVDARGSCWCGCERAQEQIADVLAALREAQDAMVAAGKTLDGPVEVGGMSIPMYSVDYVTWPLASDLAPLTIPLAEFQKHRELPFEAFVGPDAASLRALRTAAGQDLWHGTYVAHRGLFYELYILDVIPEPFAAAIADFERKPRT